MTSTGCAARSTPSPVGVGTVLADDPQLTVRPRRPSRPPSRQPLRVVFDRSGRTPADARGARRRRRDPHHGSPSTAALEQLRERGVVSVLLEGGPDPRRRILGRRTDRQGRRLRRTGRCWAAGATRPSLGAGIDTIADAPPPSPRRRHPLRRRRPAHQLPGRSVNRTCSPASWRNWARCPPSNQLADAARLTVRAQVVGAATSGLGDSISVNGVCLTVTGWGLEQGEDPRRSPPSPSTCTSTSWPSRCDRSSLGAASRRRPGQPRARGHGRHPARWPRGPGPRRRRRDVAAREPAEHWDVVQITAPDEVTRYLVEKGSVTVDGVSLTVVEVDRRRLHRQPHPRDAAPHHARIPRRSATRSIWRST